MKSDVRTGPLLGGQIHPTLISFALKVLEYVGHPQRMKGVYGVVGELGLVG